jgi:acyl transferase domain-containing protein/acyl carrier protein
MASKGNGLEIAVIGISGRFPGSKGIDHFWQNLINGVELIRPFPDADHPTKVGAVLDNVDQFDASFFGFNPREAETMDPQHRLFLECAWEALEDAGYDSETEERLIGIYAGVGMGTYLLYNLSPNPGLIESRGFLQTLIGVDKDYLSSRVSYKLNLKGPSLSVGTACSSSLVAVHLACQGLLAGECDMALAAGVAVKVPQNEVTLSPNEIVSPSGHCRAFDAEANGTIGGNGVGVVVLKRLDDAITDRDHIYAVIKGSAINNDGAMKVGYTAPSQEGQTRAIQAAHLMAEVEPHTITYVETHGTGTALGDPIEIASMSQAFQNGSDQTGYCAIGSVKTNVGHLDAAAGMAGLIKTILALDHKLLPPSLNFETPNPKIDFANSPFYVNTQLCEWQTNGIPRRAGVSSFGFGGTNAHLVLEEAPHLEDSGSARSQHLIVLSAKTSSALDTATTNLVRYLKQHPHLNLADVAYTLQVGRRTFNHRRFAVASTLETLIQILETEQSSQTFTGVSQSGVPPIVFMFPGQGSQYINMAQELYQSEPKFREECNRCFTILQPLLKTDLRHVIYPMDATIAEASQNLKQTAIAQPALFVIEYALAKLWMSWGVYPNAMIGHSIGEYVAACLAGVFSLDDALLLVVKRGQLMQAQSPGAMLSVNLSVDAVQPFLEKDLNLAASNAPSLSVVSGSIDAIKRLEHRLVENQINYRRLHTSHAFHSPMMDAILHPFTQQVQQVTLNPPQIPFISNVTGTWITVQDATDPGYWARHLRQGVQFSQGITELLKEPQTVFLEVGPGRTLNTLVKQQTLEQTVLSSLPSPKDNQSELTVLLNALGYLWLSGVNVNWIGIYTHQTRNRVSLPTYPFERQRYWIDPPEQTNGNHSAPLTKRSDIADWFYVPSWTRLPLPLSDEAEQQQIWLVFVDSYGLGDKMVKRLEQQGHMVIQVRIGDKFCRVSDHHYVIHPGDRHHYEALINEVLPSGKSPIIAHLWTVTPNLSFAASQELGFYSLLYLAQAISHQQVSHPLHLKVVSSGIQDVIGTETIYPEKATILGPCRVIPQECPNVTCCSIDVGIPESDSSLEEPFIDRIITELATHSTHAVVAYRSNYRWVPTYNAIRLEKNHHQPPLRQRGVYLITGGLGGIGLAVANYLAKTVQAKLILVSRSPLPPRDEWQHWLDTRPEQDAITAKIQNVQALEELGAEVLVLSADVADGDQMRGALKQAQQRFGETHGVFHAAGMPGNGIIQLKTPEMAATVMSPKVNGTLVLSHLFNDKPLDFLLLFSSVSSITGGIGQVDYCAANAFLDQFAHKLTRSKTSNNHSLVTSINWDAWQEIGMGVNSIAQLPDNQKQEQLEILKTGISPDEGLEGLQRILASGLEQVIVSTRDWQAVLNQSQHWVPPTDTSVDSEDITSSQSAPHTNSLKTTAYVAPRTDIEQQIAAIWQEQLGIKQVGIHDNFFELGGHSLLAVRVISRLREQYPVELSLRILLEAPTVAGVASAIAQQLPQPGADEMSQVLAEIESLSLDEVQAQLTQRLQTDQEMK